MNRACTLTLALLMVGGCGAHGAERASAPRTTTVRAPGPLAPIIARIATALRGSGLSRSNELGGGFIAEGQGTTLEVTLPARRCTALVAVGSVGLADLDAALYEGSGRQLAMDREPDAHPTVAVCAGDRALTAYYRLDAYRGVGEYAILRFEGDAGALAQLKSRLGGEPGIRVDIGRASALEEAMAGAARRGFVPRGARRRVALPADTAVRLPLPVRSGTCIAVIALPIAPSGTVTLVLHDEADVVRAHDRAGGTLARVQACVRQDSNWTVELLSGGAGEAEVQVLEARQAQVGGESALFWGVRPERGAATEHGQQAASGSLLPGQVSVVQINLREGRCATLIGAGEESLGVLSLRALVGDVRSGDASAELRVCRSAGMPAVQIVVSGRGFGDYRLLRSSEDVR